MGIADEVDVCSKAFRTLLTQVQDVEHALQGPAAVNLTNTKQKFDLWTHSTAARRRDKNSLEHKLRDASHIQTAVLGFVHDLIEAIDRVSRIVLGERVPWDQMSHDRITSDDEDDDDMSVGSFPPSDSSCGEEDTEIDQLLQHMSTLVEALLVLSISIQNPAPHDRFMKSLRFDPTVYSESDIQYVRDKFPAIDTWLAERLGRANSWRRQYFAYRERHHELRTADAPDNQTVISSLPAGMTIKPDKPHDDSAVTAHADGDSDSGFTQTSFQTTLPGGSKLEIPRMPDEAADGATFSCPLCHNLTKAGSRSLWKKHIFMDLQPYVCLYRDCKAWNAAFSARHHWQKHQTAHLSHLTPGTLGSMDLRQQISQAQAHDNEMAVVNNEESRTWSCPMCKETIPSEKKYYKHISHHQQQISLFAIPRSLLSEGDEEQADALDNHSSSSDGVATGEHPQEVLGDEAAIDESATEDPGATEVSSDIKDFDVLTGEDVNTVSNYVSDASHELLPMGYSRPLDAEGVISSVATAEPTTTPNTHVEIPNAWGWRHQVLKEPDLEEEAYFNRTSTDDEIDELDVAMLRLPKGKDKLTNRVNPLISFPDEEEDGAVIDKLAQDDSEGQAFSLPWIPSVAPETPKDFAPPDSVAEERKLWSKDEDEVSRIAISDGKRRSSPTGAEDVERAYGIEVPPVQESTSKGIPLEEFFEAKQQYEWADDESPTLGRGRLQEKDRKQRKRAATVAIEQESSTRAREIEKIKENVRQVYYCKFKPCSYSSKRESNCNQHMEKAHGWTYVRTKSDGRARKKKGDDLGNSSLLAPRDPFAPFSGINDATSLKGTAQNQDDPQPWEQAKQPWHLAKHEDMLGTESQELETRVENEEYRQREAAILLEHTRRLRRDAVSHPIVDKDDAAKKILKDTLDTVQKLLTEQEKAMIEYEKQFFEDHAAERKKKEDAQGR